MNTAVGKISVHTVDLRQVSGTADRTHIHLQLLVTTIITVCERKVHALIIPQIHGSTDQCTDGFFIVADRITYILNLTAIAKLPETTLQILFLDRGYILGYMAVETVAPEGRRDSLPVFRRLRKDSHLPSCTDLPCH